MSLGFRVGGLRFRTKLLRALRFLEVIAHFLALGFGGGGGGGTRIEANSSELRPSGGGCMIQALPGPWTSFLFWVLSYIFIGYIPKKVGHPGSR